MGLHIDSPGASFMDDGSEKVIADRPLFTNADCSRLLEAGDVDSAFQVASRAGKVVAPQYVASLDLVVNDGRVEQRSDAPAEDKQIAPAEDKMSTPNENKSSGKKKRRLGRKSNDA